MKIGKYEEHCKSLLSLKVVVCKILSWLGTEYTNLLFVNVYVMNCFKIYFPPLYHKPMFTHVIFNLIKICHITMYLIFKTKI